MWKDGHLAVAEELPELSTWVGEIAVLQNQLEYTLKMKNRVK